MKRTTENDYKIITIDNIVTVRIQGAELVFHFKDADNRDCFETYVGTASDIEVYYARDGQSEKESTSTR